MEIGDKLNQRYTLTAKLGSGAMGDVFQATDSQSNQTVAVKVLDRRLTLDPEIVERFKREVEALRQLRHRHIVSFVDTFQHEGQQVIVMEYVAGGSLHQLIKRGPLPVEQARQMAIDLCDALTSAHRLNIIHRDIKPENVLVGAEGTPKLTDFGVARLVSEGTRLTGTGTQIGTPFYMSPEAWQGQPLDAQADIWSLGIMLYEMLTGDVPFGGDTLVAVMNKVLTSPLPDLKKLRPDTPPALVKIVRRMLERDKAKRYQSLREVVLDLERATATPAPLPTIAPAPHPPAAPTQVAPPAKGGLPRWAWVAGGLGLALALCVLAAGGGALAMRMMSQATPTAAPMATATAQPADTPVHATSPAATVAATAVPQPTAALQPTVVPQPTIVPLSLAAPDCNYGGELKSIEAVDATTVKFTLCTPDPAFASKVAFPAFAILSKATIDATGGDSAKLSDLANIHGTGPYLVQDWVRGDHIAFVANPNYWGDAPKTKTVIFRWSSSAAQRLLELQAGTVDGIDNPAPESLATIQKDGQLKLYMRPALNIFYLGLNNTFKPLDTERVRQAIAMSIDKQRIVDNFYPAGSTVAEQFLPRLITPGYSETGDGAKWYAYDPAQAKQLLTEAGFPNGFQLTLAYRDVVRDYLPQAARVAEDIQAQLADVGIQVTLNAMEPGAFFDSVGAGKEAFFMLGWSADYLDATNFYDPHFTGGSPRLGDEFPDLVTEIKAGAALVDPAERQKHYDQVNALIKKHVPVIPIANGGSAAAFRADATGTHASPLNNENLAMMMTQGKDQFVWMQTGEPASLYCGEQSDPDTMRACAQVYEALLSYKAGGVEVQPGLAQSYDMNQALTEWVFHLRSGVRFSDGSALTANDVVASFAAQWDAKNPNHKGNTGDFYYFSAYFGAFLNAPK